MNLLKLSASVAVFMVACSTTVVSNAEIKKCLEGDGSISYSDRACENALVVEKLDVQEIAPAGLTVLQAYQAQTAIDGPSTPLLPEIADDSSPAVQSQWAQMPAKQIRYSTDVETVSQARETLALLDRQLPSAR
ncbi:MAG: hypothetical protein V4695_07435 [Pseudomonadota bacterium]